MEIYGLTHDQIRVAAENANVHADWQGYTKANVRLKGDGDDSSAGGKYPGHIVRLRNEPDNTSGARGVKAWRSHGSQRKANGDYRGKGGVCWHGHYKFILEVFKMNPDARVSSRMMVRVDSGVSANVPESVYTRWGKITYDGIGNFSAYAHETGRITYQEGWNGRKRLTLRDTCWCEQGDGERLVYDTLIRSAAIVAIEHEYREKVS
jgi:hypothetical protein